MKFNLNNFFNLKGKTVLIVGGLGLLGQEITRALSGAESKVIVLDNKKSVDKKFAQALKLHKTKIIYEKVDISSLKNAEKKLKQLLKKYGVPQIYINCSYPRTIDWSKNSFKKIKLNSFRKNIDMHLNSYSWLARVVAEEMLKNKIRGSIIHFNSIYGVVGQDENIYAKTNMKENMTYSIIKGGLINFTKQMASHYGKNGIRINSLCIGGIEGHVAGQKKQKKNFIKNYSKRCPLKRLGKPSDVIGATLFLASDASSYVTGSVVMVDGGWTSI